MVARSAPVFCKAKARTSPRSILLSPFRVESIFHWYLEWNDATDDDDDKCEDDNDDDDAMEECLVCKVMMTTKMMRMMPMMSMMRNKYLNNYNMNKF